MDFTSKSAALRCLVRTLGDEGAAHLDKKLLIAAQDLEQGDLNADGTSVEAAIATLLLTERWDCVCVGLLVGCDALAELGKAAVDLDGLKKCMTTAIHQHLEHREPRVRALVVKALGVLCKSSTGVGVYTHFGDQLWSTTKKYLEARETDTMATNYKGSEQILLDDVTGWKCLETSLLALVAVADACAGDLQRAGLLDESLWVALGVEAAARHRNRFVREASMGMARALLDTCEVDVSGLQAMLAPTIAAGLADPWPQVVHSASKAARSLLNVSRGNRDVLAVVLPRLCMNRYYVPEGVQTYSQETWEGVFGAVGGRATVAERVHSVAHEYVSALHDQQSHFCRVAACHAVRELACKVDAKAVATQADKLLHAVMHCLEDNHWEVRSAACIAAAQIVTSFPDIAVSSVDQLLRLCIVNLEHESWSIREDAACALADVGRSIKGQRVVERLVGRLRDTIMAAKKQPAQTTHEHVRLVNDVAAHTGRPVFGCCGSLDTKESHRARVAQPWEVTDGALYLLRELCHEDIRPDGLAVEFMPILADVIRLDHFPQADRLRQTAWTVIPEIASRLGKRTAKNYLELFTPTMCSTLTSPLASQLTRHAAVGCLEGLSRIIGPTIFLARLPEHDRPLVQSLLGGYNSDIINGHMAIRSAAAVTTSADVRQTIPLVSF